ncbi:hypothetical protein [Halosegnis sp.]|uniref:DUF7266 family protein n=1 Tax=Halosegnis sp. TaxID=2864959 RepID=UPI0035D50B72
MVGFVLTLGISSLLVTGLLIAAGGFVENQRQGTIREELEVTGQQVASTLSSADRLVRRGATDVRRTRPLPSRTTGTSYTIEVADLAGDRVRITLSTSDPDISVTVDVKLQTPVRDATVSGGDLIVTHDTGTNELVVARV